MTKRRLAPLLLTTALGAMLSAPALAASSADAEVVITARKLSTPLWKAPLSVSVIDGGTLESLQAHDLKEAQFLTSSLLITSTANEAQTTARLRGVGTVGDNPALDSSVGVVIDGVSRARTATAMGDLGPLERIEVLKGPQSDVYGRGASAGVISVTTRAPSFTRQGRYEVTLGEHGTKGAQAWLTGPLTGDLAGALTLTRRVRDGQYSVKTGEGPRTATSDNTQDVTAINGQLLYRPSEALSVRAIADYARRDEMCCTGTGVTVGGTRAYIDQLATDEGTATVADPDARRAWSNRPTDQVIEDRGLSVQADYTINRTLSLTSITSARQWDHTNGYDADFTSADIYFRYPDGGFGNHFETLSQEVRLTGTWDRFDAMLGVYFDSERLQRDDQTIYGADYESYLGLLLSGGADIDRISTYTGLPVGESFVAGEGNHDHYSQRTTSSAVFAQASWRPVDSVTVMAALRGNHQDKTLVSRFANSDSGKACAAATTHSGSGLSVICLPWSNPAFNNLTLVQSGSEDVTTGSVRLRWQATQHVMLWSSYAEGWKGAGFNLDREQKSDRTADTDSRFAAETSRSTEVGMKASYGPLAFAVTAFDERFRNFQLNTFLGTTFLVTSVPHLTSKGVELEGRVSPIDGLTLTGGLTHAETRFGPEAVTGLPLLANNTASFAPRWSGVYTADYERPVAGHTLRLTINARHNSDYNTGSDLNPIKVQSAFTLYNGQVSFGAEDESWALSLWGTNLTDETYYQVVFAAPFQSGTFDAFMGQPRTVGLTLRLKR